MRAPVYLRASERERERKEPGCRSLSKQNMKKNELLSEPQEYSDNMSNIDLAINLERQKFPFCIVWTPLPILT